MEDKLKNTSAELTIRDVFISLKQWYNFIFQRIKTIIIILIFGMILGFVYAKISSPKFNANLTFALEEESAMPTSLGGAAGIASKLGLDISSSGGGLFAGSNIIELMKSRLMIEKTLLNQVLVDGNSITLADLYIKSNNLSKKFKSNSKNIFPISLNRNQFNRFQDSVLKIIYSQIIENDLNIYQKDKKVGIVTIDVSSPNQIFSKYFCEILANEASLFYIEIKTKKSRINLEILENQIEKVKSDLNSEIYEAAELSDGVYNLNPAYNKKGTPARFKQIDVQAKSAILVQLLPNLEISKLNLKKQTPLIQILDRPTFPLDIDKISVLQSILMATLLTLVLLLIFYTAKFLVTSNK